MDAVEARSGPVAPVPVRVVEARGIHEQEIEWADVGERGDLAVDAGGGLVVGDAEPHGIGVDRAFEVGELLLAENAVQDATGLDRLDEAAGGSEQEGQGPARDGLAPLVFPELLGVAAQSEQLDHAVEGGEVGDREPCEIASAERSVRLSDAAVAGRAEVRGRADQKQVILGIAGSFDRVAGPLHFREVMCERLAVAAGEQDLGLHHHAGRRGFVEPVV